MIVLKYDLHVIKLHSINIILIKIYLIKAHKMSKIYK